MIVSVTTDTDGAAGIVTLPYAAVVHDPERDDAVAEALAEDLKAAPSARALSR